jgi:16S rRNA (cytosine967-C5)-methyltransferase
VAAFQALRAVASAKSDLPVALAAARSGLDDERDRALTTELVTGALRWQNELDFLIGHFSRRSISRLDPDVLQILRLGAYQLLHLERVPAAAAVNDAVALTRRARKTSAGGLVNAVLRALSRTSREKLPLPDATTSPLDYLEISLSHPRWLAARWASRLGFEVAETWERFNNAAPPLSLRVNRLKTDPDQLAAALLKYGVRVSEARYAPDGLVVESGNPLRTPLAGTGDFFVQDEASQLVSLLAAPKPGDLVLDACASPGGKTTGMAAAAGDRAFIVASDVRDARMQLLRETVSLSGSASIRLVQANLQQSLPFGERFDVVFVDAPCSGLGTIRRDPDIRWRRREEDLIGFQTSQLTMLRNAAAVVKPAGRLIYSTCSSEPEENDAVVEQFLSNAGNFRLLDVRGTLPVLAPVLDERGILRTFPDVHRLEAFFGAVLQRHAR